VFAGSTDAAVFEDFVEQLLQTYGRWPAPKSVLVMDNASIHRSDRVKTLCAKAGVRLIYLALYSPDMNPIEEFFAEIKGYIKQQRHRHSELFNRDFDAFLRLCIDVVGSRATSAQGHFRHSGLFVEDPPQ
jgi:transposase